MQHSVCVSPFSPPWSFGDLLAELIANVGFVYQLFFRFFAGRKWLVLRCATRCPPLPERPLTSFLRRPPRRNPEGRLPALAQQAGRKGRLIRRRPAFRASG